MGAKHAGVVSVLLLLGCSRAETERHREPPSGAREAVQSLERTPALAGRLGVGRTLVDVGDGFRADGPIRAKLPLRSDGALRVEANDSIWIELSPLDVQSVAGERVDGAIVYTTDHERRVYAGTALGIEDLRILRNATSSKSSRYHVQKGPGVGSVRARAGRIEVLDDTGNARIRTDEPFAVDAAGERLPVSLTIDGDVLEVALNEASSAYPIVIDPAWVPTASLAVPRKLHTTTVLPSGKVLVVGGEPGGGTVAYSTAEIYDPVTRTWTLTAPMKDTRSTHAAALLSDGRVMVAGGGPFIFGGSSSTPCMSSGEIYDPAKDTWTSTAAMSVPRWVTKGWAVGTKFVVMGGRQCGNNGVYSDAELYDPATDKWTPSTNKMASQRAYFAGAPLPSGKILVSGGWPGYGTVSTADVYDATTNSFTVTGTLKQDRMWHTTVTLADGKVLITGGVRYTGSWISLSSAEIYDPLSSVHTLLTASMGAVRVGPAMGTMSDGTVIIAGGSGNSPGSATKLSTSEIFDPTTKTFAPGPNMAFTRAFAEGAVIQAGARFLVPGGENDTSSNGTPTNSVESFASGVALGASCGSAGECASGLCVDGVCCDSPCTGACEACDVASSKGTCVPVTGAPHGTKSCGTGDCAGSCAGKFASCTYPFGTTCGTASCTGSVATPAGSCDGKGTCKSATPSDCTPYACGATGCLAFCSGDADCVASAFCDGSSCVAKKSDGEPAKAATECTSGIVADGVCCKTACDGACQACNLAASAGTCSAVDGFPDIHGKCPGSAACVGACKAGACTMKDSVACSGTADAGPYSPGNVINGTFTKCIHDSECSTGHCVEGVCCDTACTDRCHSCALITSPGICTVEPIGVDLKSECGPANQCLGTCGGGSECIGSGKGSECDRARCTGASTGVGPAYCPGPGATCDTNEAVPFDCGPYVCEPAFGACRTECNASSDCANGFICDVGSKTCVAPAPPGDSGGCAFGRRSTTSGFALFAMLVVAARRRRHFLRV